MAQSTLIKDQFGQFFGLINFCYKGPILEYNLKIQVTNIYNQIQYFSRLNLNDELWMENVTIEIDTIL